MDALQKLRIEAKTLLEEGYIESISATEIDKLPKRALRKLIRQSKPIGLNTLNETLCVGLVDSVSALCRRTPILSDKTIGSLRSDLLESDVFISQSAGVIGKVSNHTSTITFALTSFIVCGYIAEKVYSVLFKEPEADPSQEVL